MAVSDAIDLPFVKNSDSSLLAGRRLLVSFHIAGSSGPMTWHAKALTTSYLTAPRAGSHGRDETDDAFPLTTTSWYFLDAVDVMAPDDTVRIVVFRRLDHRRHGLHAQRRRPLARRALAPAASGARRQGLGRECRHRRQSGRFTGLVLDRISHPRRTVRPRAFRPRRLRPVGRQRRYLARRHQRSSGTAPRRMRSSPGCAKSSGAAARAGSRSSGQPLFRRWAAHPRTARRTSTPSGASSTLLSHARQL